MVNDYRWVGKKNAGHTRVRGGILMHVPGIFRFSFFVFQLFRLGTRRFGLSAASAMIRRQSANVRSAATASFGMR